MLAATFETRRVDGTPTSEVTRSLCGKSLHLTLVTVMVMNDLLPSPLLNVNRPYHSATYSYFKIWPWKSLVNAMCVVKGLGHIWTLKDQGHCQGQTWWSHLRPWVQSICLLFVSWKSDHFGLRWKLKVKVMAKVKPDSHIWGPVFNLYVCFLFRGNRTIFGWDIANSIFDLENSRSKSRRKSTKI